MFGFLDIFFGTISIIRFWSQKCKWIWWFREVKFAETLFSAVCRMTVLLQLDNYVFQIFVIMRNSTCHILVNEVTYFFLCIHPVFRCLLSMYAHEENHVLEIQSLGIVNNFVQRITRRLQNSGIETEMEMLCCCNRICLQPFTSFMVCHLLNIIFT